VGDAIRRVLALEGEERRRRRRRRDLIILKI
jgi:hypothetical protein